MFAEVRRSGSRGRCGPVSVTFAQVNGVERAVVGYAVGRRVGNAVVRNRLRRRIRAVMGELSSSLSPGAYVVSAGIEAAALSPGELHSTVSQATRRAQTDRGKKSQVNGV